MHAADAEERRHRHSRYQSLSFDACAGGVFSLFAIADESPLTGKTGAARMAQLSIADALFMAVARIHPGATETNLGCKISAVRTQREPW